MLAYWLTVAVAWVVDAAGGVLPVVVGEAGEPDAQAAVHRNVAATAAPAHNDRRRSLMSVESVGSGALAGSSDRSVSLVQLAALPYRRITASALAGRRPT